MTDPTPYRLLFCDDDPAMLKLMTSHFSQLGHEVHQATTGAEAIERYGEVRPEVTVLDIDMPEMSGLEALPILRQQGAAVIMLTAQSEITLALKALKLGAENYLVKPTDMEHLEGMIERAIDRVRGSTS